MSRRTYAELQRRVRELIVAFGPEATPQVTAEVFDWTREDDRKRYGVMTINGVHARCRSYPCVCLDEAANRTLGETK